MFEIQALDNVGICNILKSLISYSSIGETIISGNDKIKTVLHNKYIKTCQENTRLVFTWRFLLLNTEIDQPHFSSEFDRDKYIGNLFINDKYIDLCYDRSFICETVKNRILNVINNIEYNKDFIEIVNYYKDNMKKNNSLAVTVRTWKAVHEKDINRPYDFNIFKDMIIDVCNKNKVDIIYISIDNMDYIEEYVNLLKILKIEYIILNNSVLNHVQNSLYKLHILSQCTYLIGNRISTFTELIFWFSNLKIIPFLLF